MESEAFTPNALFSGEVAGTYRNYVAVFYCTDYARKNLTTCSADKGAVFYFADPSPALHFGKTAESIATTKSAACAVSEAPATTSTSRPATKTGPVSGSTLAPTTISTAAPTTTQPRVVTMKLTVKNLGYQKLIQNTKIRTAFIAAIKKAIIAAIKRNGGKDIPAKYIILALSSGSVVVDATIDNVAAGVDHGTLKASLTSDKSAVESDVLTEVKNIAGIASIKTFSDQSIEVVSETAPKPTTKPSSASSSITLECSSGFTLSIFLTAVSFMQ